MNHLGGLLMMLLFMAIANPAQNANPVTPSELKVTTTVQSQATLPEPTSKTQSLARPIGKERLRRAARIDLKMPYYRFGRLPIRIKD
ncbi:MAG: hypothetical protein SGI99_07290 [Pseudomonadota bacterium]|nr:hypothetical protein [Pseudomonadota bacterium]